MNWYYALGDQRQGPVSDSDLNALLAAGTINESTLVWKEGMTGWMPVKEARGASRGDAAGPAGWIQCTATGRYFPPEEIVYLDGKPYSAAAKPAVLQGVLQTGTLPSTDLDRTGPPWENRETLGFFPAIFQTVKGVMLEPAATFSAMRREGGLGAPLIYLVIMTWVAVCVVAFYNVALRGFFMGLAPQTQNSPFNQAMVSNTILVVMVVLWPLITVIMAFISAGVFHLSLMLCQGAKQPFETTFRTYCYAFGSVVVLQLIPVCGGTIAFVWAIVAMCIGVARTHEITGGRAALSVLLPIGVCCVSVIIFYAIIFAVIFAGASQSGHH